MFIIEIMLFEINVIWYQDVDIWRCGEMVHAYKWSIIASLHHKPREFGKETKCVTD